MKIHRYPLPTIRYSTCRCRRSRCPSHRDGTTSIPAVRTLPRPTEEHVDLWALVPEEAPVVPYHIAIVGTGHPMPDELKTLPEAAAKFVGTAVMPSGYVWHLFWTSP